MLKTLVFLAAAAVMVLGNTIEHHHDEHDHEHHDHEHHDHEHHDHDHEHDHEHTHDHYHESKDVKQVGVAHLEGKFGHKIIEGDLTFTMKTKDVMVISGVVKGMPPGKYGMNIHESGDISNECKNTLGHFNPHGHHHGHHDDEHRHVGDLGNIEFNSEGVAHVDITDNLAKLWGEEGVVGRSIVLSSMEDDHGKTEHPSSLIDGNTGDRVACGVIGIK